MEWEDEEAAQESARHPRPIGWFGPGRGQTARQARKRPQRRSGQKRQEKNCRSTQRQTPTCGTPKEKIVAAVGAIRSRFGCGAIGLGSSGIRYSAAALC